MERIVARCMENSDRLLQRLTPIIVVSEHLKDFNGKKVREDRKNGSVNQADNLTHKSSISPLSI